MSLPTGAATSAAQTTIIGHLDGVEGLLTTIDADTGTLAVTGGGTEAGALRVTIANNSTGVVSVDDNAASLTVDAPVGTPVFVRLSDGAAAITALPVTDNGGSLTVDGTVAVSGTVNVADGGGSLTIDGTIAATQSGTWTVQHSSTGMGDGRKTVATAGTAEALAGSTAAKTVVITAELDNTGLVVVGGSTVVATLATRRGTPLSAGDTIAMPIDNLADVFLDVTVSGDGVTYSFTT